MAVEAKLFEDLRSLPVSAVVLDADGVIVSVNQGWKDFAVSNGLAFPDFGVGRNYLDYCPADAGAAGAAESIRALLDRRLDVFTLLYPCHSPDEQRWFALVGVPLSEGGSGGAALMHVNLTELLPQGPGPQIGWNGGLLGGLEQTATSSDARA